MPPSPSLTPQSPLTHRKDNHPELHALLAGGRNRHPSSEPITVALAKRELAASEERGLMALSIAREQVMRNLSLPQRGKALVADDALKRVRRDNAENRARATDALAAAHRAAECAHTLFIHIEQPMHREVLHELAQEEEGEDIIVHEMVREGDTLLHVAKRYGSDDCARLLLELGADARATNRVGICAGKTVCEFVPGKMMEVKA